MTTMRYEELRVWQESMNLAKDTFQEFKSCKEYWLKDQILRSSLSIPSNIAEGHDRETLKEYIRFLSIARASCSEVRTQLMLAQEIKIISLSDCTNLINSSRKITAMLNKQIFYLKSKL